MANFNMLTIEFRLGFTWRIVCLIFLAGFFVHSTVFLEPHREGDERIYSTLVTQLENGKGYTLLGSSLLDSGAISKEQYSGKLFHHPPGGIALFWFFYKIFNLFGYPFLQLFSFSLFFWSMMLLGNSIGLSSTKYGPIILAGLSAFNPIMSHVITNFWLDGPLLAFSTCAVAIFIWAAMREKLLFVILAGIIFGYSGLIKQTVILIIPGLALFAWFFLKPPKLWPYIKIGLCFLVPAITMQLPWVIWQWFTNAGTSFSGSAGHPIKSLIESNPYIRYVTVVRSPWIYLSLLPRIIWTIGPSILLYIVLLHDKKIRSIGFSFLLWIGIILAVHIALGFMGYSKLMRYVILIALPTALLFSLLMNEVILKLKNGGISFIRPGLVRALLVIASGAFLLEIAAGIRSAVLYKLDLIIPFVGKY